MEGRERKISPKVLCVQAVWKLVNTRPAKHISSPVAPSVQQCCGLWLRSEEPRCGLPEALCQ